jgi:c-di-GMP-binding flagellar brake protein YcgR
MSASPTTFARRSQGLLTRIAPDRRRHKRIAVELLGRFMRENKQEHPCKLIDISAGGAAIKPMSSVQVAAGERVVAFFDHIGGIEGTVVREFEGGFAFRLHATQHKREKLAATLTWLANRSELTGADERRHERIVPKSGRQQLQLAEGITLECEVLDISVSGASIGTPARPELGTEVMLGKLRARVVRHHAHGFGVQFIDTQNQATLRRQFG